MEEKKVKKSRDSNIELLRILAILGVIILHYNNSVIGGGFKHVLPDSSNQYILIMLESLTICAVNVFIMISGYFMCMTDKRTLWKPLRLIVQVMVINGAFSIINSIMYGGFSIKGFIGAIIPENYFVLLFSAMYIISPFVNIVINSLSNKGLKNFVIVLIVVFSLYQTAVDVAGLIIGRNLFGLSPVSADGGLQGYSIVNFLIMYIIGAYIRKNNIDFSMKKLIAALVFILFSFGLWTRINKMAGIAFSSVVWDYCNPLVIALAVCVFLIFRKIKLGNIKIINEFAKAAFTVYLTHSFFLRFIRIEQFVKSQWYVMLCHILVSAVLIYLAGYIIYFVYENTVGRLISVLEKKLPTFELFRNS